jgi:protein tyrosine/serine phosphatase
MQEMSKELPFWQTDKLPQKMLEIREIFLKKHEKPLVIYFHCGQGQDRTGEFAGSYQMTFKGRKFLRIF